MATPARMTSGAQIPTKRQPGWPQPHRQDCQQAGAGGMPGGEGMRVGAAIDISPIAFGRCLRTVNFNQKNKSCRD